MIHPHPPPTVIPVKILESPYHKEPIENKTRVQSFILTEDLMAFRAYYPRKGQIDSVIAGLFRGFLKHVQSLDLQARPQSFCKNEQIFIKLIEQYVPGTEHSRIKYTLDEAGNPDVSVLPPNGPS